MTPESRDWFIRECERVGVRFKPADGPLRYERKTSLPAMNEAFTSKTTGGLTIIGCDYGAKSSIAIVMRANADGSFTVIEEVEGKGLDDLDRSTSAERKSDDPSDAESDGR